MAKNPAKAAGDIAGKGLDKIQKTGGSLLKLLFNKWTIGGTILGAAALTAGAAAAAPLVVGNAIASQAAPTTLAGLFHAAVHTVGAVWTHGGPELLKVPLSLIP